MKKILLLSLFILGIALVGLFEGSISAAQLNNGNGADLGTPGITNPASAATPPVSGMQIWYRGDSLTCTGGCTGTNAVTVLLDKSSNANNANIGIAGHFVANALNGKPGVLFDGTTSAYAFTAINIESASTVFVVAALTSAANANNTVIAGVANSLQYSLGVGSKEQTLTKTNVASLASGTAASDTSYHQMNYTYDGTTLNFRLGRASDGSTAPATAITATETILGENPANSSNFLNGTLAELIVYNRVLTGPEITTVETYLNTRYGI